jgi:hypothetical protein
LSANGRARERVYDTDCDAGGVRNDSQIDADYADGLPVTLSASGYDAIMPAWGRGHVSSMHDVLRQPE